MVTPSGDPALWELFGSGPRGVLITVKRDGRPQSSNVGYLWDPRSRAALISITNDRAKTRNLRHDPRVSLHVSTTDLGAYVVGEGLAELSPVADDPDGIVADRLVEHYRALQGEHPDFVKFRIAMVQEKRLILRIAVTHIYGWRPNQ